MKFDLILDQIGDWNPQVFREIKGRLNPRNIWSTVGTSTLCQVVFLMACLSDMPGQDYQVTGTYCRLREETSFERIYCPTSQIDYQLWWQDNSPNMFAVLSFISIFLLLVAGTFLLINDLGREKQRGTLNFIKLSPQSSNSILVGKILGVPILIYLGILMTLPLSLFLGFMAQISGLEMLGFYTIIIASCAFYFSAALLLIMIDTEINGFQSWLISLLLFGFLCITSFGFQYIEGITTWLRLFSPTVVLPFLTPFDYDYNQEWQWFFIQIGQNIIALTTLAIVNYVFWTYWIVKGLNRHFRNPNLTLLSKAQSYGMTLFGNLFLGGFLLQKELLENRYSMSENIVGLIILDFLLIFVYIACLSPHRQTLMDWSRYRHEQDKSSNLVPDLIWGEKSPAIIAIALNISFTILPLLIVTVGLSRQDKDEWVFGILFGIFLLLIYATVAQIMLMMKSKRRAILTVLTLLALQTLSPLILVILDLRPYQNQVFWLFSTFPWAVINYATALQMSLTVWGQVLIFIGLNLYLTQKLRLAGESELKALISK